MMPLLMYKLPVMHACRDREVHRECEELSEETLPDIRVPFSFKKVHNDVFDEVEMLEVRPEHDKVEGRLGLQLPGVGVDGVEVLERVG